jgi:hypothetical protein
MTDTGINSSGWMLCEVKSKEEEHPGLTSAIGLQRAGVEASTTEWGIHGGGDGCAHRQRSQSRAGPTTKRLYLFVTSV